MNWIFGICIKSKPISQNSICNQHLYQFLVFLWWDHLPCLNAAIIEFHIENCLPILTLPWILDTFSLIVIRAASRPRFRPGFQVGPILKIVFYKPDPSPLIAPTLIAAHPCFWFGLSYWKHLRHFKGSSSLKCLNKAHTSKPCDADFFLYLDNPSSHRGFPGADQGVRPPLLGTTAPPEDYPDSTGHPQGHPSSWLHPGAHSALQLTHRPPQVDLGSTWFLHPPTGPPLTRVHLDPLWI